MAARRKDEYVGPERIRFHVNEELLTDEEGDEMRQLLARVFGLTAEELQPRMNREHGRRCVTIVCRPNQFARFIVLRCEQGMRNWVHPLRPEILGLTLAPIEVDVSGRPSLPYYPS